jgi:hypothetical protein
MDDKPYVIEEQLLTEISSLFQTIENISDNAYNNLSLRDFIELLVSMARGKPVAIRYKKSTFHADFRFIFEYLKLLKEQNEDFDLFHLSVLLRGLYL